MPVSSLLTDRGRFFFGVSGLRGSSVSWREDRFPQLFVRVLVLCLGARGELLFILYIGYQRLAPERSSHKNASMVQNKSES